MAARSKAWVCGLSIPGIAGSNPAGGHECLSLLNVVSSQVEVSETRLSLEQGISTDCGVSERDLETSTMGRPRPTRSAEP